VVTGEGQATGLVDAQVASNDSPFAVA
jgi:hypothetical protein